MACMPERLSMPDSDVIMFEMFFLKLCSCAACFLSVAIWFNATLRDSVSC